MDNTNKELFQRNLIDDELYQLMQAIRTKKMVTFYYKLREMNCLGIMLFTGGVGWYPI